MDVRNLDHPRYKVVVVDDGSIDGSFEAIKSHVERIGLRLGLLGLSETLGLLVETVLLIV